MIDKNKKPNILWIMTDEQRCDSLGCYNSPWAKTPNIDRLAQEGTVFVNAVTPASMCVPARLSLLTGKYPHELGVWNNHPFIESEDHLTYCFKEEGYITVSFGKQHYQTYKKAFDIEVSFHLSDEVGYTKYNEKYNEDNFDVMKFKGRVPWILGGRFPSTVEHTQEHMVMDLAKEFLSNHNEEKPFFLRLSLNGPHTPVTNPSEFYNTIKQEDIVYPEETIKISDDLAVWIKELQNGYSGSSVLSQQAYEKARTYYYNYVSYIDYEIGDILEWMQKRGLLDNTIIVFVSDHGTHIGDYGLVQKQTFYDPVVNVPFIIWYPQKIKAGTRIETPVETRWLMPTLLDIAQIDIPERINCNELTNTLISGIEPNFGPVFSEFILNSTPSMDKDKLFMVRNDRYKLSLRCLDGGRITDIYLYDIEQDPYEKNNLAKETSLSEIKNEMIDIIKNRM